MSDRGWRALSTAMGLLFFVGFFPGVVTVVGIWWIVQGDSTVGEIAPYAVAATVLLGTAVAIDRYGREQCGDNWGR